MLNNKILKKTNIKVYSWYLKQFILTSKYYIALLISLLFFYIPFIPFSIKLKICSPLSIPLLSSQLLKNIFRFDIISFSHSYLEKIRKKSSTTIKEFLVLSWLVASNKVDKNLTKKFVNLIFNLNKDSIHILENRYTILFPFMILGDYLTRDKLLLITRQRYNSLLKRKPGFYFEKSHFTAIGHICLFVYLLQAVKKDILDAENFSFVYSPFLTSNQIFSEIVLEYARRVNVKIIKSNAEFFDNNFDLELEVWPNIKLNNSEFLAREKYKELAILLNNSSDEFPFKIPRNYEKIAEEILAPHLKNSFIVGLHLRSALDDRTARNPSLKNSRYICSLIKSSGGLPILVGANELFKKQLKGLAISLDSISSSQYEYEILQLYIWGKSKIWVGSQSGGSMPATLFGTPTMWLDYHPSGHFQPPNNIDIFLPRKVFCRKLNRFLSWEESVSDEHSYGQSESLIYALKYGYEIHPADQSIVKEAYQYLMNYNINSDKEFTTIRSRIFI